jgi:uncharacterized protein
MIENNRDVMTRIQSAGTFLTIFVPIPAARLPFQSILVASGNDPYLPIEVAMRMARWWGSEFADVGRQGHINIASGHGPWAAGERLLERLCEAGL